MSHVGIDISQQALDWSVVETADGEVVAEGVVAKSAAGIASLVRMVPAYGPTLIVMEATGAYHRPVLRALVAADLPVTLVNPLHIVGFRQVRLGRAKTDRQDARLLARVGATYVTELRPYVTPTTIQAQ